MSATDIVRGEEDATVAAVAEAIAEARPFVHVYPTERHGESLVIRVTPDGDGSVVSLICSSRTVLTGWRAEQQAVAILWKVLVYGLRERLPCTP